ncbi:unnamed protein product [Plutella xylostella]|uniref:(diamondback moth) hypothetical protein n=1 Tax=Plutella xylostella TaxID=51655 RepID=A0A8S4FNJ9_PLUXY|nr:unnamed protein product [Plutella xylostella]
MPLKIVHEKDDKETKHGRSPPSDLLQTAPIGKSPSFDNIYKYLDMDTKPHVNMNMSTTIGKKNCTEKSCNSSDNDKANTPKKTEEVHNVSDLPNSKPTDEGIYEKASKKYLDVQKSTKQPTSVLKETKNSEESSTAIDILRKNTTTISNDTREPGKKLSIYNAFNDYLLKSVKIPENSTTNAPGSLYVDNDNVNSFPEADGLDTGDREKKAIPAQGQHNHNKSKSKSKPKKKPSHLLQEITNKIKNSVLKDLRKEMPNEYQQSKKQEDYKNKLKEVPNELLEALTKEIKSKILRDLKKDITDHVKESLTEQTVTLKDKDMANQAEPQTEVKFKKDATTPDKTKHHKRKHIATTTTKTTTTTSERVIEKRIEIETAEQSEETDKKEPPEVKSLPHIPPNNNHPPAGVFTVKKHTDTAHASQHAQATNNVIYNSIPLNFQKLANFPPLPAIITSTPGNGVMYPAGDIPGYPGMFNPFNYNGYPQAVPQQLVNKQMDVSNRQIQDSLVMGGSAMVISVPSSTVLATTVSTTTTRRPTTVPRSPSTTTESADKKAENAMVLDKLSQLFEQIQTLKAKIDNPPKQQPMTETKLISHDYVASDGGRVPIYRTSFPQQRESGNLAPLLGTNILDVSRAVYNKRDPYVVDIPRPVPPPVLPPVPPTVPPPSRPVAPRHLPAMTIQTNSYDIPPLGIPIKVKKTPFGTIVQNQNIVVITTRRPYSSVEDKTWNVQRSAHHRRPMDQSASKPAYETILMTYHNKKTHEALEEVNDQGNLGRFQLRYNSQTNEEKHSPKFAHPKAEPDLYEPLHEYRPKNVNFDSYLAEQQWNAPKNFASSASKHRTPHVSEPPLQEFKDPDYKEAEPEHRLKHFSDPKIEKRPEHHHTKHQFKHHFSQLDAIESRERERERSSLENAHTVRVPHRHQMSMKRRPSTYDDTHFKNFLKTQQKVNAMLERMLAAKPKTVNKQVSNRRTVEKVRL